VNVNSLSAMNDSLASLQLTTPMELFLTITALSFLPLLFVALTTFTRNIVVLSFLRQGLGLQQSPPNIVLISLAFFITLFSMSPVLEKSYSEGVKPYLDKKATIDVGAEKAWLPMREFLLRQTGEKELELVYDLAKQALPKVTEQVKASYLIPAFMLSELKLAFQMGFVILLPFLMVDLVVSAMLMSLGMIMVPPATISLPMKILLFIAVDGWGLIAKVLVSSVSV